MYDLDPESGLIRNGTDIVLRPYVENTVHYALPYLQPNSRGIYRRRRLP